MPLCDPKRPPFEAVESVTVRCIRDVGSSSSSDITEALALLESLGTVGDADRARRNADPKSDLVCENLEGERCRSPRGSLWGIGMRDIKGDDCDIRDALLGYIVGQVGGEVGSPGDGIVCVISGASGRLAFKRRSEDVLISGF